MQLRISIICCLFIFSHFFNKTQAQNNTNEKLNLASDTTKPELKQIEIDLLGSYYNQDGNNSPVTGGRGTENLHDITNNIIISIPYGKNVYSINIGQDFITSASTDNMDTDVSSDSKKDVRTHGDIGVTRKITKRKSYHVGAGFSSEYDVTSFSLNGGVALESKNRNSSLDVNAKVYSDFWLLYQPIEFRTGVDSTVLANFSGEDYHDNYGSSSGNDNRTSYNFSMSFAQILTKKLQVSFTTDFVYQTGLLHTPFHRVYFNDGIDVSNLNEIEVIRSDKLRKRELLPDTRMKIPLGFRLHYYLSSTFVFRGFYRYYYDDFGVVGNTFEVELPIRFSKAISFYPFYRYHTQTASDYFAPFGIHDIADQFYTSDYDLSAFNSNHFGIGFKYAPLFGIGRNEKSKKATIKVKSLNLRYANYSRSNQLNANLLSFGLAFTVF